MRITIDRAAFEWVIEYSPRIRSGVRPQHASSEKKLNWLLRFYLQEVPNARSQKSFFFPTRTL